MQGHAVFGFCDQEAQNQCMLAIGMVGDLVEGRSPEIGSKASDFLVEVRGRLQFFARAKKGSKVLARIGCGHVQRST